MCNKFDEDLCKNGLFCQWKTENEKCELIALDSDLDLINLRKIECGKNDIWKKWLSGSIVASLILGKIYSYYFLFFLK